MTPFSYYQHSHPPRAAIRRDDIMDRYILIRADEDFLEMIKKNGLGVPKPSAAEPGWYFVAVDRRLSITAVMDWLNLAAMGPLLRDSLPPAPSVKGRRPVVEVGIGTVVDVAADHDFIEVLRCVGVGRVDEWGIDGWTHRVVVPQSMWPDRVAEWLNSVASGQGWGGRWLYGIDFGRNKEIFIYDDMLRNPWAGRERGRVVGGYERREDAQRFAENTHLCPVRKIIYDGADCEKCRVHVVVHEVVDNGREFFLVLALSAEAKAVISVLVPCAMLPGEYGEYGPTPLEKLGNGYRRWLFKFRNSEQLEIARRFFSNPNGAEALVRMKAAK